ncbi:hypothetical protein Tco_0825340 [Tanacetum coccineum]
MSSSSSSSRSYRRFYTKEEILAMTHCKCEILIYQQVAWTPTISSRRFKGCLKYDKGKKYGVYGFIDDELPFKYYKELFYKLHMENKELRSKLRNFSSQECSHNNSIPNKPSQEVPMEVILKELNALKLKVWLPPLTLVDALDRLAPKDGVPCLVVPYLLVGSIELPISPTPITLIMEYLVKISKKERILELKRKNMKKTNSDIQYVISIKEDTTYLYLHFTKDHEGNKINTPYPENPIRCIQAMEIKYSGRYRTWSLL